MKNVWNDVPSDFRNENFYQKKKKKKEKENKIASTAIFIILYNK